MSFSFSLSAFGAHAESEEFKALSKELFASEAACDSISLNYLLANPENYGIEPIEPSYPQVGADYINESISKYEGVLERMEKIDPTKLSQGDQLTYDVLKRTLENQLEFKNYTYFLEYLSPSLGLQAQLPILLAEYNFRKKADIEDYLSLIEQTSALFKDVIDFEKEKKEKNLFMAKDTVQEVINQCTEFIGDPESNVLITYVNTKIDGFKGLTSLEKESFKSRNKTAVLEQFIPAYKQLIADLQELNKDNKREGSLSSRLGYKDYYSIFVSSSVNSSKTIPQMQSMMNAAWEKSSKFLSGKNLSDYANVLEIVKASPEEILESLKKSIAKDFPAMQSVDSKVEYVHESMQGYLSPAFYLMPAIDSYKDSTIYINNASLASRNGSWLYTTLAHEGYPGHLYQNVYYRQTNPDPVRSVMSFTGYSEGWAVYCEFLSYQYCASNKASADVLTNNAIRTYALYGMTDIGVNYYGWSLDQLNDFLEKHGLSNRGAASGMYSLVLEDPGNYLNYTIGYLEMSALREKAEKELGAKFVLKDFHELILSTGPVWFDILEKELDNWIAERTMKKAS
jgi:uncharacterized protein (DUF885 family)